MLESCELNQTLNSKRENLQNVFSKSVEKLNVGYKEIQNNFHQQIVKLKQRYSSALEPDIGRKTLLAEIEKKKEEMKQRHEREMKELESQSEMRIKTFEDQIPVLKKLAASQYMSLKRNYEAQQKNFQEDAQQDLRNTLIQYLPMVNESYEIGDPINSTQSAFVGMDIKTKQRVVLKSFPAGLSFNKILKHECLVPVLGKLLACIFFVILKKFLSRYNQHK